MSMPTDVADADTAWVCARKKGYSDEKIVKAVVRRMNEDNSSGRARPGLENVVVRAYACTRCGMFHIGRVVKDS